MYPQFSEGLLKLLDERRASRPVYLDVVFWYYEQAGGRIDTEATDGALDPDLARGALVSAYNTRYGTEESALDAILTAGAQ